MATEYLGIEQQNVNLNSPVVMDTSIPCRKGLVYHENGTGVFILRGITNGQCFATYQLVFNGNIALPTGAAIVPIAIAVSTNGELRPSSKAIVTPVGTGEFSNVTSTAIIQVPRGCCFTLSVDAVAANATETPAPSILVENANLTINRIA